MLATRQFAVIIPTMQRSPLLWEQLPHYLASELVAEVVIINNVPAAIDLEHPKLRVLAQERNIYVNPAWNLGVASSTAALLCIANDDLLFDPHLLHAAARILRMPCGILGPNESTFMGVTSEALADSTGRAGRLRVKPVYRRTAGFGTLMFMRRSSYVPIPETMRIHFGDDYLFHQQRHRNLTFSGFPVTTPMSTTTSDPGFLPLWDGDLRGYRAVAPTRFERRFGWEPKAARSLARTAKRLRRR